MERRLFKPDLMVPYTAMGDAIGYKGYDYDYPEFKQKNFIFEDVLSFTGFYRGRSSIKAHFESTTTNNKYEMFIVDLEKILLNTDQNLREIKGEFCFRKAGANFGVVLLDEENENA